jgi:hypothetical protein
MRQVEALIDAEPALAVNVSTEVRNPLSFVMPVRSRCPGGVCKCLGIVCLCVCTCQCVYCVLCIVFVCVRMCVCCVFACVCCVRVCTCRRPAGLCMAHAFLRWSFLACALQLASLQHSLGQAHAWEAKASRIVLAMQSRLGTQGAWVFVVGPLDPPPSPSALMRDRPPLLPRATCRSSCFNAVQRMRGRRHPSTSAR